MKHFAIVATIIALAFAFAGINHALAASSSTNEGVPSGDGCCATTPDYGTKIDIGTTGHVDGDVIGASLQAAYDVVFPPATVPPAPGAPTVEAQPDGARPFDCSLTFSGLPHFTGPEAMQFLSSAGVHLAVSKVGVSEGGNDSVGSVELAAYDCSGNLIDSVVNTTADFGFEFLSIDAGVPIIHYITVGGAGDPAGADINCITFDARVPCGPTPTEPSTWGRVKSLYR